jgi:MinD-like ATPase involved in chromosome partitioning or flagellar assembly
MICKKIAVWGRAGCGKSTLAVNLALALASRNAMTGLISSNLLYADIQAFFGQKIYDDKGLFNAMKERAGKSVKEMFWKCGLSENLFILGVPNLYSGLEADAVTLPMAEKLFDGCGIHFDYLIIDCKEDITNPVSTVGLTRAEDILTVYRPSVISGLWHTAMSQFCEQLNLTSRMIPVLNADQNDCGNFASNLKISFTYELPYTKSAAASENQGKPLYLLDNGPAKRYAKAVDKIADYICKRR